jgi:hypothetical protein
MRNPPVQIQWYGQAGRRYKRLAWVLPGYLESDLALLIQVRLSSSQTPGV